jgi:phosphoglycolate phosphatase-like HAD superfamily hydrolase
MQHAKYSTINYGKIAGMTLDLARIKALCFDVDGTLSDTDDLYANQISGLLPRFLFPDPEHTARRLVMWVESPGNALLGFADTIGLDDEMMALIDWMNRHRAHTLKHFCLCQVWTRCSHPFMDTFHWQLSLPGMRKAPCAF